MAISSCIITIPTGHTGVVVTFGKVEKYVLDEGVHFKLPWQNVVKMNNRTQKETLELSAFSSDIQQVDVVCSINFRIDKDTSQDLYKDVGIYYYDKVMMPRIMENLKAVFTDYSAENLVASRNELSTKVEGLLEPEMKSYGIQIINISIEDIDFTDAYTNAVEAKQVAEQAKLQATIEQEQKTMEQKAISERQIIAAKSEAEAITVKAEAEAAANAKIAASLTKELVDYNEIQKWNGQLPQVYGADGVLPVLGDLNNANTQG